MSPDLDRCQREALQPPLTTEHWQLHFVRELVLQDVGQSHRVAIRESDICIPGPVVEDLETIFPLAQGESGVHSHIQGLAVELIPLVDCQ
jgi:hypothetical protein